MNILFFFSLAYQRSSPPPPAHPRQCQRRRGRQRPHEPLGYPGRRGAALHAGRRCTCGQTVSSTAVLINRGDAADHRIRLWLLCFYIYKRTTLHRRQRSHAAHHLRRRRQQLPQVLGVASAAPGGEGGGRCRQPAPSQVSCVRANDS
jgi:hypothetical protein